MQPLLVALGLIAIMTNISFIRFFLFFSSLLLVCLSCDKDPEKYKPEPAPCLAYLSSLNSTNEVFLTFQYYNPVNLAEPETYEGIIIEITPQFPIDSFPKIITITFDSNGVICPDNKIRKGKITCRLNSNWAQQPSRADITLTDFYIDNTKINGLFSYSSSELNDSLKIEYKVINGLVTSENNDTCSFNMNYLIMANYSREQRSLNPFSWYSADTFDFSGQDFNKNSFDVIISKRLYFDETCSDGEITLGEIMVTPSASTDFSADFGNGECDRKLNLIFSGNSFPISF